MNIFMSSYAGGGSMAELLVALLVLEVGGTLLTGFSLMVLALLEVQKRNDK